MTEKKFANAETDIENYLLGKFPAKDKWGPFLSERGWGTVREDYSANGDAWTYFTYDEARSRAYRRAEDGIAGLSDRFQILIFSPAFWNEKDPYLKERLFGLTPEEGNHGEDVKEIYYYLDALPDHSYLKYLYKYPQGEFPYDRLIKENGKRSEKDREFELIDTGVFDENRYFDIFVEYAKAGEDDICIRIEAVNRGPVAAKLHIVPQLWFRNQWSWGRDKETVPFISLGDDNQSHLCIIADDTALKTPRQLIFDYHLGKRFLYATPGGKPLFTNNETNTELLWKKPNESRFVKDAFHRYITQEQKDAINPANVGTKAGIQYVSEVAPAQSVVFHLRLTNQSIENPLEDIEKIIVAKRKEADEFYGKIHPAQASEEEKSIQRQALSGMVWSKQFYLYDVGVWLQGDDPDHPPPEQHRWIRNFRWRHVISARIFSMPDCWEYPWFAAWDLTFQSLAFSLIDIQFAKEQIWLLLFDHFQHPNGAIPAYEWEFNDVNPPVQAWAVLKLFEMERQQTGEEDYAFVEKCYHKLLLNFAWWINKVDGFGNNVFEGGFLGMDNISFQDRSAKQPEGYLLDECDGAGWMSLFCLNLMRMSLILAKKDPIYEQLAIKFLFHFIFITAAMRKGYWRPYDLWNEEDGFFYSVLRKPDGTADVLPIRSLVGIIPFFACDIWDEEEIKKFPEFYACYTWINQERPELVKKCIQVIPHSSGTRHLFGLLSGDEMHRFLRYIWDPKEFRSDFGVRSLSKIHEEYPIEYHKNVLKYEPGEALERVKGGNSNWRGPLWFPINYLLIDTLHRIEEAYKDMKIKVDNEKEVTIAEMASGLEERLLNLFKKDAEGKRPMYGDYEKFQNDPHFQEHLFFYEHFHGDTGRGLGASHQNGWTGLIANIIQNLRK